MTRIRRAMMSRIFCKVTPSLAASSVLFLLVLSSPHSYAQARQKSSIHFQNDVKKLLSLIRQDKWQEAGPFAYEMVRRSPTSADADGLYALVLLRGGYPQEAAGEARQALELDAKSYWALVASARIELWDGKTTQAKKLFQRAAQVRPQGAEARLGLCLCARTGSPDEAKAIFAYLALSPTGHPHDRLVAELTSFIRGHKIRRGASAESFEAEYPAAAHRIFDIRSPGGVQRPPVVIPMTSEDTGLFVTAVVDGHPMRLLLDTGADGITLTRRAARRLPLVLKGTSTISGIQGSEQSTDYLAKSLHLGPLRWSSVPIQTESVGYGDGVLGIDLLRHYVVCLDFAHHTMRLTSGAEAPLAGNGRQRLQFREYETKIMFPAQVGGQDVWAVLDTGATRSIASRRIAETLAAGLPTTTIQRAVNTDQMAIGKTSTKFSYLGLNHSFHIALGQRPLQVTLTVPNLVGASPVDDQLSPALDFEVGLIVGMSYLLPFQQLTIDYKHQSLLFDRRLEDTPVGNAAAPP